MKAGVQIFRDAFDQAGEGMLLTDDALKIVAANQAFQKLTQFAADEVLGKRPVMLTGLLDGPAEARLRQTGLWHEEIWAHRRDESRFLGAVSVNRIQPEGGPPHFLWMLRDLTGEDGEGDGVGASRDPLTRLPNRLLLIDRLQRVCERCRRANTRAALLLVELHGFRGVNESMGQEIGDLLLVQVADRLRRTLRQSDTAARLDAGEFAIILNEVSHEMDPELVGRNILDRLSQEFMVAGQSIYVSGSIGVTVLPDDGNAWTRLIRNADIALSEARRSGRSAIRFFTETLNAGVQLRTEVEQGLRAALQRGEFSLRFQPVVDISGETLVATEALLRWNHPRRGVIGPDQFIEVAEETGLITDIGQWVFSEVIKTLLGWRDDGVPLCQVTINLADRQLRKPAALEKPLAALKESGLPPGLIEAEVSEAVLKDSTPSVLQSLAMLSEAGIGLVLDDFDTGYTSLRLLKQFPVKSLRIDRIFVRDVETEENRAVVGAMIALANSLGIPIVAKGVESPTQRAWLKDHGCDWVQGFLMSRPLEEPEMRRFLLRMLGSKTPA